MNTKGTNLSVQITEGQNHRGTSTEMFIWILVSLQLMKLFVIRCPYCGGVYMLL